MPVPGGGNQPRKVVALPHHPLPIGIPEGLMNKIANILSPKLFLYDFSSAAAR